MKYFVSPKDVVDMIQKYDPLANQDPLPEPPVSVADVRAMFDTQRVQKSAMMRGVGTTNVQELVENFDALQKVPAMPVYSKCWYLRGAFRVRGGYAKGLQPWRNSRQE